MKEKERKKLIKEYEKGIEESKVRFYEAIRSMEQNIKEMRDAM